MPAAIFDLRYTASLTEEYSSNFNRSTRDTRENLRTSLSPGLALFINAPFTKGSIGYSLSGAHDSSTDDTNLFHSLAGQVSWQATPRLTLSASDALTRNDEPALADALGLRQERRTFTSNTFSLTSNYRIANIGTSQFYRLNTFFDPGGSDTISHVFGAGASTAIYQSNTASVGYQYHTSETGGTENFGHQLTASLARQLSTFAAAGVSASYGLNTSRSATGAEVDSTVTNFSLFNTYAIPGKWSLTGSIGYIQLTREGGEDISTLTTATNLSVTPLARGTLTINLDNGLSQTFAEGENFGIVQTRGIRVSLSYPLTPFITGTASAFGRQSEFTGVGGGASGKSESWGTSLSFSIPLLRWLSMGLDGSHTEQGDIIDNRLRLSLNASF